MRGNARIDGSSPDNARDGSASSDGSGPASSAGKVYARNHCLTPRKVALGSNLMNMGRDAARGHRLCGWPTPKPGWRSGEEAMMKVCGVVMAMLPG
jgi:hypothetical protein